LIMVASQYRQDYQINNSLEATFLAELAKQSYERSPN